MSHNDRGHSRLAPSAAYRWLNCPGSVRLAEQYPEDEAGEAAQFGTECHEGLEWALTHMATEWRWSTEAWEMVRPALDYILARKAELGPKCVMHVEERQDLSWIHPELFGTPDVVLEVPGEFVEVIDLKTGFEFVPADSVQLLLYTLNYWKWTHCNRYRATIVQPAHDPVVRSYDHDPEAVAAFVSAVLLAADAALDYPDPPITPGPWCKYCPATGCAKRAEDAMNDIKQYAPNDPAAISNEDLGKALDIEKKVLAFFKAAKKEALRRAHQGAPPTGWKLVQGRQGNRRWSDELAAAALARAAGVEFYEKIAKSPTALEKEMGKEAFKGFADCIDRADGAPTLVPESDKRPAITSAEAEFDD